MLKQKEERVRSKTSIPQKEEEIVPTAQRKKPVEEEEMKAPSNAAVE
jgi:hypothetical protein